MIHFVVAEDQTCGVPGRFIGHSVSLLREVAHFASTSGSSVAILSLDQGKAFDRVDWSLRSTLVCMGFGISFISWVDLFYAGVQSAVKVNGFVTPFSVFPVVFGKAALFYLYCMFFMRRS